MISVKDRKELNRLRQEVDVKINSFGLRLRRLENEILMLKTQNYEIKNLNKGEE